MAKKKRARSAEFRTVECRLSYVQHMVTRRVKKHPVTHEPILDDQGNEVTEQQCTLIFPISTDKTPFDSAIRSVVVEEWGPKGVELAKAGMIKMPYLAGDGKEAKSKETGELHGGMGSDVWFIRTATQMECPVRYKSQHVMPKYGSGPDDIKSGDYGFAVLTAFAWENAESGKGVSFGINYLQKKRDGEALGGTGPDAEQTVSTYYEAVAGTEQLASASASALFN